jgi:hypothetical protein
MYAELDEEKKHEGTVDEGEEIEEVVVVEEEEADPNALNPAFVNTFPVRNHSTYMAKMSKSGKLRRRMLSLNCTYFLDDEGAADREGFVGDDLLTDSLRATWSRM